MDVSFEKNHLPFLNVQRVDSNTPWHERKKIRQQLRQQVFGSDGQDTLLVATDVFGKSITLYINGLVDTGLSMAVDSNGFLIVGQSSRAEEIQRMGRGGRVTQTLYKKLYPADIPNASEVPYVMEKRVAMSLVAARVRLGRAFPIIGVPSSLEKRCIRKDSCAYWRQLTKAQMPPKKAHDDFRKRKRRTLKS